MAGKARCGVDVGAKPLNEWHTVHGDAKRSAPAIVELNVPDPVQYFEDFWPPSFTQMGAEEDGAAPEDAVSHPVTVALADRGRKMMAAEHYHTATVTRSQISMAFNRLFADHDLIITPTMPLAAFPHPLRTVGGNTEINGLPVSRPHIDFHRFTESPSHAGLPAITVPCGFARQGLPVGLQIIGPLFADAAVLVAAAAVERILPWAGYRPKL